MCDHCGILCLLASNSQSTTLCVTLTSSRTIWLQRGVWVTPGHNSVTNVVALLMPWVRPMGAKWNLGTRGTPSDLNLSHCVCGSLVALDVQAIGVRMNLVYDKHFCRADMDDNIFSSKCCFYSSSLLLIPYSVTDIWAGLDCLRLCMLWTQSAKKESRSGKHNMNLLFDAQTRPNRYTH